MQKFITAAAVAAIAFLPLSAATAATIDPSDFDLIFTEGKRTTTIDGADVSGHAWNDRNSDIKSFDLGELNTKDDVLLVGWLGAGGADVYFSTSTTGRVEVSVINFAQSDYAFDDEAAFGARFELSVNDALVSHLELAGVGGDLIENQSLLPTTANDDRISLRILGLDAYTDFDIAIRVRSENAAAQVASVIGTVPLPAGLPLMAGALAMIGMASLRRGRARR